MSLTRLSKFLAVMLRHEPRKFGLSPDAEGYVSLQAVLEQIEKRYPARYSRADLDAVIAGDASGKKRYEIVILSIRADQAHADGIVFYHPEAEHYLARYVPREYIEESNE